MDAEFNEDKRNSYLESRKQRWSMNSQRLEKIVAELMRPIGDLRRSFDTDLSALLEEYLTEAGLHALDADSGDEGEGGAGAGAGGGHAAPNFVELALLLQQSASIYGRKVDCLYQHVLSVSDALHGAAASLAETSNQSTEEEAGARAGETPSRRRAAPAAGEWALIEVEAARGAAREAGEPARPPPTLPRAYVELEPRALAPADAPLTDYAGEPVGLLPDFHVAWRLHEGMLVEDLEAGGAGEGAGGGGLRAIPLTELQAALSARAPPLPPASPPPSPPPPPHSPHSPPSARSTPLPAPAAPGSPAPSPLPPPDTCARKRKRDPHPDALPVKIKLLISKEVRRELRREREFGVPAPWVRAAVRQRCARVLALRRAAAEPSPPPEFRGFEYSSCDADGFLGWSSAEAAGARAAAGETATEATRLAEPYSDDDGFFEQSSSGDSDEPSQHLHNSSTDSGAEWWSWQAGVAARAAAAEARGGVDVRALAARVLRALPPPPAAAPAARVLAAAAEPADVSHLFLATLFLANAGNVEVIQGAPLSVNSFSLRLVSSDERLYSAAAAADAALLQPAAAADSAVASAVTSASSAARRRDAVR